MGFMVLANKYIIINIWRFAMKIYSIFFLFALLCIAKELDSKHSKLMIKNYETFFKEAFAQSYETFKMQKDSKSGLSYIDFCAYPPDRSLPFGALDNGRFKGELIKDLPFTCDKSSGAKKYFIQNKNIQSSYEIIKTLPIASFLQDTLPNKNKETIKQNSKTTILWQNDSNAKRLWILYRNNILDQSCNIIFTQKDRHTEVILQYLNMQY